MAIPNLARNILLALVFGIILGVLAPTYSDYFSWFSLIFKLSLMMVAVPLILTSVLSSMEHIGDITKLGKLGLKTIFFYAFTTIIAIGLGTVVINYFEPGIIRPNQVITQAIKKAETQTQETLPLAILQNIEQQNLILTDPIRAEFLKQVSAKIEAGKPNYQVKNHAINIIGGLEYRSKLTKKNQHTENNTDNSVAQNMSLSSFLKSQVASALVNPFKGLAESNILAVIIFALLFGGAMTTIGQSGRIFFELNNAAHQAIIKVVFLVLRFAPYGIFALIFEVTANSGIEIFKGVSFYIFCVMIGLLLHMFVVLPIILLLLGNISPLRFFTAMKPALLLTFTSGSSSAALPLVIKCAENNLKLPKKISRFVLSLGSSLNMNGTALYEAMAAMFIAQLYGMDLTLTTQLLIGVTAALAATGCSTMPSAGAVSLTLVFAAVGIPLEGIGLLLAVDLPLSMTRAMVNVTGDAVGAVIINNSEQSLPLAEQIEDLDKLDHLEIPTLPETFAPHVVSQVNS